MVILRWRRMTTDLKENLVRVVILDISDIYAQIHNQEYFDRNLIESYSKSIL